MEESNSSIATSEQIPPLPTCLQYAKYKIPLMDDQKYTISLSGEDLNRILKLLDQAEKKLRDNYKKATTVYEYKHRHPAIMLIAISNEYLELPINLTGIPNDLTSKCLEFTASKVCVALKQRYTITIFGGGLIKILQIIDRDERLRQNAREKKHIKTARVKPPNLWIMKIGNELLDKAVNITDVKA